MKIETILRRIIYVGIFLIPFIPFLVMDGQFLPAMFFPFITGKNFVFRVVIEVILVCWLILAFRDSRYAPRNSWILKAIAVFLCVMAVADILSVNPTKSFWSNFERMEGYLALLHFGAFFLVSGTMLRVGKLWDKLLNTTLGASLGIALYGFLQIAGAFGIHQGSTRIDATIGNSSYLAVYAIIHLFLALFLLVRWLRQSKTKGIDGKIWPIFYGIVVVVNATVLYFTATRGALIGATVALLFISICLAFWEKGNQTLRRSGAGVLAAVVIALLLLVGTRNSDFVKGSQVLSRFSNLITEVGSFSLDKLCQGEAKSRCLIWPMAWEGIKTNPVFGWGQESFNYLFYTHYSPKMYAQEPWFDRAHNVFLDWAVAGGLLGLISYLSIFFAALWYLWKGQVKGSDDPLGFPERAVLTGLLIAYFIHNIFVFDQLISYIFFFLLLAYLHSLYSEPFSVKVIAAYEKNRADVAKIGIPIVIILGVIGLWYFNLNGARQAMLLTQATTPQSSGVAKNIELFTKVLDLSPIGRYEAREQLTQLAVQASQANFDPAVKTQLYNFAFTELKKQLDETPLDVRYYYFMTSILASYGRFDEAVPYLEKAVTLSPNKQIILFNLAGAYINTGKIPQAMEVFKRAYDLEPSYPEARLQYALGAIYARNEKLLSDLLLPVYGTILVPDERIIRAYLGTGHTDRVIQILKNGIAVNPQDVNLFINLASVYLQIGDKSSASAQIRKAMAIDPDFQARGEEYLQQIRDAK